MFNNVVLIGRLVEKPPLRILEDGIKVANFVLAVTRPFKNPSGDFDTDFIPGSLWYNNAVNVNQYCDKGDLILVKGRISHRIQEIDSKNYSTLEFIGERVLFLSGKAKYENSSSATDKEEISNVEEEIL